MANGHDIEELLIRFAVSVLDLCEGFPKTFAGTHLKSTYRISDLSGAELPRSTRV